MFFHFDREFEENTEAMLRALLHGQIHNHNQQENLMSQVTDWAAKEQADLDTLITNFQNSPGTLSAEDQAALDAIQASSKALVTKATAISVNPPV